MAEVSFTIGHKDYTVSAQAGEEKLLKRAAAMLDAEAQQLLDQAGRLPEPRLLLLAGLMLADRTAQIEDRLAKTEAELSRIRANPARVEVPVIPADLREAMAELAARAESLAERAEDALGG